MSADRPPRRNYAEASRPADHLAPSEMAKALGINEQTARRHMRAAAAGEASRLPTVVGEPPEPSTKRDLMGRLWVNRRALAGFRAVDPDALERIQ